MATLSKKNVTPMKKKTDVQTNKHTAQPTPTPIGPTEVDLVAEMGTQGVQINLDNDPNAKIAVQHLYSILKATMRITPSGQEHEWLLRHIKRVKAVLDAQFTGFNPTEFYQAVGMTDHEIQQTGCLIATNECLDNQPI